jgi:hypothetical protein
MITLATLDQATHGPFEYSDSAVDWAEIYAVDSDWWVSEVEPV